jgi:hypothetical protein
MGYDAREEDLPTLYIGQADGIRQRIDSHYQEKDFWDWGIAFMSNSSGGLNRAHVTWLEYELVKRAKQANRCQLDNGNLPQEPALTEAEKADTKGFLKEILQILPLVGLRAFEHPVPVAQPKAATAKATAKVGSGVPDTIIVPAQEEGFERVFLGQHCWHAIRISGGMLSKIKYIAAYQTQPVSAVTHYAPVDRIEPYGEGGKYKLIFSDKPKKIGPVPFGDATPGAMQGPCYTTIEKLKSAKRLSDLIGKS